VIEKSSKHNKTLLNDTILNRYRPLLSLDPVNYRGAIADLPDLLERQRDAHTAFLQADIPHAERTDRGLHAMLSSAFPVKGKNTNGIYVLEYDSYEVRDYTCTIQHAHRNHMTYARPLYVKFRLSAWDLTETTCHSIVEENICLGNIPCPTPKGTFIINGVERVIVSQAHRSSGMFFDQSKGKTDDYRAFVGRIVPYKGAWIDLESDSKNLLYIRVDRKKILATTLLMTLDDHETWQKRQTQTLDPRAPRGFSKQAILGAVYKTFEAHKQQDGRWKIETVRELWDGHVLRHDLFNINGELLGSIGSRPNTQTLPAELLIPQNGLHHTFLARDLVKPNGVVVAEAGTCITEELLDAHDHLHIVAVRDGHPTAALCTTVAAEKCITRWEAIAETIKVLRPGENLLPQVAETYVTELFFNPNRYDLAEIGRTKVNERTGATYTDRTLRADDFFAMIRTLLKIRNGTEEFDDIDSLRNRRIRCVDELLEAHCRQSIVKLAMSARDRIAAAAPSESDSLMPSTILLTKPIVIAFREFFSSSQLSQLGDACNPLSEVAHGNRLSAMGPGGLTREYASFEVRDVHASHYGRICPIETPEGASVGLINSRAIHAKINKYGFMETKYRVVKNGIPTDEVVSLAYADERDKIIAPFTFVAPDQQLPGTLITCRYNGDIVKVQPAEVQLMDISPFQSISVSASLIPFLSHNDPSRALMGANMQRQALPLVHTEAPYVCTGSEQSVAIDSGAVITARNAGRIVSFDHTMIVIQPHNPLKPNDRYDLVRFVKSNAGTFIHHRLVKDLDIGHEVKAGQVIADCSASEMGEIALGKNVLVAFAPWRGYNFEDAVVVSKRLVDEEVYTSIHISQHDAIAHDTKSGEELFTRDIPNVAPELLAKLDENGIIQIGAEVKHGDILVGKVTPKTETHTIPEDKLLRSIFGDKATDVYDLSLRVPAGVQGVVTDVQIISRRGYMTEEEIVAVTNREREQVMRAQKIELSLWYDALRSRIDQNSTLAFTPDTNNNLYKQIQEAFSKHNKTYNTALPIPEEESIGALLTWDTLLTLPSTLILNLPLRDQSNRLEHLRDELKTLGVAHEKQLQELTSAYKAGSEELPPGVMRSVRVFITSKRRIQPGDKVAGRHGNKCVVSIVVPEEDMPYMEDGTPIDILFSPLAVPSRLNLGQILELVSGMIARSLRKQLGTALASNNIPEVRRLLSKAQNEDLSNTSDQHILQIADQIVQRGLGVLAIPFCSPKADRITEYIKFLGLPSTCKFKLHDGRTGAPMLHPVAVGSMYIMRLNHDVDDKEHARSIGPYALVNQQPIGGRAQFGGQRVGEMEVWALQAAGAAYTLLEILTVKSDDIQSRLQAYDAFVRGDDRFTVNTPESFKIFCLYARALCLNIKYKDTQATDFIPGISDYSISTRLSDIDLRFSIASPDEILDWSYGEVESTETNYHRTDRPVQSGLFCARIFGPVNNYNCNCGKYKRMKYNGIVCEKCEVEVTHSRVRRERMGHIVLATPVTHIWFTHVLPSRIGTLLDLNLRTIENILSCEAYVVINPGNTDYSYGHIISAKEYDKIQETIDLSEHEDHANFTAETGGEAIATMLRMINLEEENGILKQELRTVSSEAKRKKILKKLELVQQLINSGTKPEWFTVTVLGVLPPGLRPLLMIDPSFGRSGSIGVNDLYKTILNRNNRLKTFMRINAPLEIVRNERRALQQAVDTLFDNGRSGSTVTDNSNRKYRSLSSFIKGKQGICRQDLLGKRVDYSGRSVIVVGPELRLDQCGLPRRMALELFKPQVMAKLESYGFTSTLRAARRMIEQEAPEVWDILAEVIRTRPVLLNRAPTLHRLGIQAFNPVLIEGKAIRLHPLVCAAFNADFDGDQMSVHVPLSVEARLEAHFIMLSTKNLLSPASGLAVIAPSQDIVLGIYELTHTYDLAPELEHVFASFEEVTQAVALGRIHLQAKIKVCVNGQIVDTTPGRVVFYEIFPSGVSFETANQVFKKKDIGRVLYQVHKSHGPEVMARFADDIKDLGFHWATHSGLTVGKDDFITVPTAAAHINQTELIVQRYKTQYSEGLLTRSELASKSIDAWTKCTEAVVADMMRHISQPDENGLNPVFKMIDSGARGSPGQLRQMIGIRGLIARADNSIMDEPILPNYKDGLNSLDLFNSNFGARKGATDTALKTSNAGHLTRKLVEACQNCVITELNCGTKAGITFTSHIDEHGTRTNMFELACGRLLCEELIDLATGQTLLPSNTLVTTEHAPIFTDHIIHKIVLRSPIKCESKTGICACCYGTDLSKDRLVSPGEAVGVIAAQSIGEPGAQLTMNTFHAGGVAQVTSSQSSITLPTAGIVRFTGKLITNKEGENIVFTRTAELALYTEDSGIELSRHRVPYAATLLVQDGERIAPGTLAAQWDPYTNPIISEHPGTVRLHDVIEGISFVKETDDLTGAVSYTITDWKQHSVPTSFQPKIEIVNPTSNRSFVFTLTPGASLEVQNNQTVEAATILARTPKGSVVSKDITGGLRRVSELLEARQNPKTQALLSEIDGYVQYEGESRGRYKFAVKSSLDETNTNTTNQEKREYLIPQYRTPIVQTGDFVRKGDPLTDGVVSAHCILRILGIDALVLYMISEVQDVYQRQGASINNKHLEIVLRQMLQKREIINPGDSILLAGNYIDNVDYETMNNELVAAGKQPIIAHPILMGITNSAIHGRSALSSVSFQNSIRTFIKESIAGTVSRITSPKDYVIVAALMDAGTGFVLRNWLRKLRAEKSIMAANTRHDSNAESVSTISTQH
jgi:DNA-directed RNA polymerase subunit beta-beta'